MTDDADPRSSALGEERLRRSAMCCPMAGEPRDDTRACTLPRHAAPAEASRRPHAESLAAGKSRPGQYEP